MATAYEPLSVPSVTSCKIMTPRQTKTYWSMWNAACKAQGWRVGAPVPQFLNSQLSTLNSQLIDALRHRCHVDAGVPESSKHINSTHHFDAIKAHLLFLANNLKGAVETDHPEHGTTRRLINKIFHYQLPLLEAVLSGSTLNSQPSTLNLTAAYLAPLLKQKYKLHRGLEDIDTLSAQPDFRPSTLNHKPSSKLERLIMDIARTIQAKRKQRIDPSTGKSWTVHELHRAANLPCPFNCRQCNGTIATLNHGPVLHSPGEGGPLAHAGPPEHDNVSF